jgi:hypothetical protein
MIAITSLFAKQFGSFSKAIGRILGDMNYDERESIEKIKRQVLNKNSPIDVSLGETLCPTCGMLISEKYLTDLILTIV